MLLVRQDAHPEGALLCAVELLPDGAGSAGCASQCCWFGRLLSRRCLALRCEAASRWCFAPSLAVAASRWCRFGRLRVAMLLVRHVARPDGALLCAVELLPDVPCAFPAGSCFPMVPCFALWSCFPMVLCTVPGGSCFSMMPERLPRRISHASAPAERQPLPHRLALRFIPPAVLRLRAPPIHDGHGRPRSVRKSSRLLWKHLSSGGGHASQK